MAERFRGAVKEVKEGKEEVPQVFFGEGDREFFFFFFFLTWGVLFVCFFPMFVLQVLEGREVAPWFVKKDAKRTLKGNIAKW